MKEKVVKLSRNKRRKIFTVVFEIMALIFYSIVKIIAQNDVTILLTIARFVIVIFVFTLAVLNAFLNAIDEKNDEIIKNNKLINIVFSDSNAVSNCLIWFICFPILIIASIYIKFSIFSIIVITIILAIFLIFVSDKIVNFFKQKIK